MSAFPGAGAQVYRNEAGEPIGWDYPDQYEPEWCELCGGRGHGEWDCEVRYAVESENDAL